MKRIAAALLLLLVSCGPKRTVLINGQTVPYEDAAGEEFRKAKSQFDQGHFDEAAEGFRRFLQRFPESELPDEGLYRRGQALSRAGKQVEAQSVLQTLLEQRPNSPFKKAAALELGLVQSKLGVKPDSAELRPLVADMSDKERQQAAASLFEAYTKSGQAGEAARWAAKAVEASPEGPEREARLKDLDTALESAPAPGAVEELAQKGAIAILGPLGVAEGLAAATRAQQLGIPIVSLSRAEGLTALGNYVFRDMPTSSSQAKAVADYAQRKLAVKRFAILQPDSPYGDEMANYFWDAGDAGSAQVRAYEHYPLRTTTFKPFVQRMVGRTPEELSERQEFADEAKKIADQIKDTYKRRKALAQLKNQQAPIVDFDPPFIPDAARTVRLVAPAVAAEDVITAGCDVKELEVVKKTTRNEQLRTVQLLGTSLWDSPDLVDERSGVARYVQCSIFIDTFYPQSERPATRKFVDDYNNAYHRNPSFLEAHAFDAAGLLKKAYEDRHPGTREEMREALAGMSKPLEGAAGDTVFGKDRAGQKPFFWLWINRGTIQEFDPEGPPPVPPAAPPPPPKEPPKPR